MTVRSLRARIEGRVGDRSIDIALETTDGPLVIVGPNGAGKTTVLSMLLGASPVRRGRIAVDDTVLLDTEEGIDVPLERRRLAYVPQDYGLFPHLDARGNVAFAVSAAAPDLDAIERAKRVERALFDLDLERLAERHPRALSGGERQRVALARALSVEPRALLMDEPLAALDVSARREMRRFLADRLRALSIPTIVVTHDPVDAEALGARIVVIEAGRVTQEGSWGDLARAPASPFVGALIASPR